MGSAIVFHQGASTGGTSILAAIISKFTSLGVGTSLLLNDSIICLLAINVFGIDKGLFGFFSLILIGLLIDKFIDGFNTCKQVFIITSKAEMVVNFISEVKIVYTVLSSNQFITLKSFIKENNPEAFITVNDSKEVLGLGFNNDY